MEYKGVYSMVEKAYSQNRRSCRVTFELPADVGAERVYLCGEFNGWSQTAQPMKRQQDGGFVLTISLKPGREYRFRYLLDGERWENDEQADAYVPNPYGSKDSVVKV